MAKRQQLIDLFRGVIKKKTSENYRDNKKHYAQQNVVRDLKCSIRETLTFSTFAYNSIVSKNLTKNVGSIRNTSSFLRP